MAEVNLQGQFNPPTFLDTRINVYAYLIVTDAAEHVLVDTGVGEGNAYIDEMFAPERSSIEEQLGQFGINPADVNILVNSHLHFDHCGNNHLFPNAENFVQSSELTAARAPYYTVAEWFDYEGARLNAVDGDLEIATGVKLIKSPGHTPGHQSVLVSTSDGNHLIAAQAASTADEYLLGGDASAHAHRGMEKEYLTSISRLRALGAGAVYFSHDDSAAASVELTDGEALQN
jgi:N-acyl homoserine lactone hydrolase